MITAKSAENAMKISLAKTQRCEEYTFYRKERGERNEDIARKDAKKKEENLRRYLGSEYDAGNYRTIFNTWPRSMPWPERLLSDLSLSTVRPG